MKEGEVRGEEKREEQGRGRRERKKKRRWGGETEVERRTRVSAKKRERKRGPRDTEKDRQKEKKTIFLPLTSFRKIFGGRKGRIFSWLLWLCGLVHSLTNGGLRPVVAVGVVRPWGCVVVIRICGVVHMCDLACMCVCVLCGRGGGRKKRTG